MHASDFRRHNGGGFLWTLEISQRIGSHLAAFAYRHKLSPTMLTLGNLTLSSSMALAITAAASSLPNGDVPSAPLGLTGILIWQLAYGMDCGDGQLARATGTGSPAGVRVDVYTDYLHQSLLCVAMCSVAVAYQPNVPIVLLSMFSVTWLISLFGGVINKGPAKSSIISSTNWYIKMLKMTRDYGFHTFIIGLILAFFPSKMTLTILGFTILNTLFLIATIILAAFESHSNWRNSFANEVATGTKIPTATINDT